jgi:predicted ABC-type ATPase
MASSKADGAIQGSVSNKHYYVFAGVNGAGKTTLYRSGMWRLPSMRTRLKRVNSDEIIREFNGDWRSDADQYQAMCIAIERINEYFAKGISFTQETTLAERKSLADLERARELGYHIKMFYVSVDSPELANDRIQHRTEVGGHGIDPHVVQRRYHASLKMLRKALAICDEVHLFDNTIALTHMRMYANGVLLDEENRRPGSWVERELSI